MRRYVARRGLPASQADNAFSALDADGDGVVTKAEWRAGLESPELRQLLRPEPADGESARAVVVCGYGPVGRAAAAAVVQRGHACVAVDLDPARVADGVVDDGANVVYGLPGVSRKAAGARRGRGGRGRSAEAESRRRRGDVDVP